MYRRLTVDEKLYAHDFTLPSVLSYTEVCEMVDYVKNMDGVLTIGLELQINNPSFYVIHSDRPVYGNSCMLRIMQHGEHNATGLQLGLLENKWQEMVLRSVNTMYPYDDTDLGKTFPNKLFGWHIPFYWMPEDHLHYIAVTRKAMKELGFTKGTYEWTSLSEKQIRSRKCMRVNFGALLTDHHYHDSDINLDSLVDNKLFTHNSSYVRESYFSGFDRTVFGEVLEFPKGREAECFSFFNDNPRIPVYSVKNSALVGEVVAVFMDSVYINYRGTTTAFSPRSLERLPYGVAQELMQKACIRINNLQKTVGSERVTIDFDSFDYGDHYKIAAVTHDYVINNYKSTSYEQLGNMFTAMGITQA